MSDEILKVVNKLYKQGDFQYVLGKFVDKHFWDGEINKISNINVDNITDFSYSSCFFLHSSTTRCEISFW